MMNSAVQLIFSCAILIRIGTSFEFFDENAWMDHDHKDNFFDYRELKGSKESIENEIKAFSNNVDFELFKQATDKLKEVN